MKVEIDSKKGLKTILKVSIGRKIIEEKIETRIQELGKTVNLKGFRPGKIPASVLKNQFGKAVYAEILEKTFLLIGKKFSHVFKFDICAPIFKLKYNTNFCISR